MGRERRALLELEQFVDQGRMSARVIGMSLFGIWMRQLENLRIFKIFCGLLFCPCLVFFHEMLRFHLSRNSVWKL